MDNNRFFFVNVCRHFLCAVYFVIVPIGYTLFIAYEFQAYLTTLQLVTGTVWRR